MRIIKTVESSSVSSTGERDQISRKSIPAKANLLAVAVSVLFLSAGSSSALAKDSTQTVSGSKPNVLLITVDGLGYGDISAKGAPFKTPNIDKLSSNGVTLNRFYGASQSSGTLAAMMTARDPHELGISYAEFYPWSPGALAPSEFLLSESLKAAGYQTALVGKWQLGSQTQRHHPNSRGFDYFFGHLNGQVDYFNHTSARGVDLQENGRSLGDSYENVFGPHLISSASVNWLNQLPEQGSKPFFMQVSYKAPRAPIQAPEELVKRVQAQSPGLSRERMIYAAMVQSVDQGVGQIISTLESQDKLKNTLVLFLSTSGADLSNGASNGVLKGGKLSGYEGGIRNLAIISGPGLSKGSSSDQVISAVDLFPTINDATGTSNGAPQIKARLQDGVSVWENLVDGSVTPHSEIFIAAEGEKGVGNDFKFSIIKDDYKVVRHVTRSYQGIEIKNELFYLASDPGETRDLSMEQPKVLTSLLSGFVSWRKKHMWTGNHYEPVPMPGWVAPTDWALRMEQREKTVSGEMGDNVFGFIGGNSLKSLDRFIYKKTEMGTIIYE
ncbi:sulfatase-like hydrolase/transferase [Endozoicomonas arenosclerae]|uniref:sulfatase-like hydrolase/transferase n=1 Tax=Endozoicomonas arenosclerae TaxID=1633495 RepID=UPI000AEAD411|nr:sulfatase-like hydrolase/transferase [Endozoicomonas arenosclerae]